jgi:hypothetical protein
MANVDTASPAQSASTQTILQPESLSRPDAAVRPDAASGVMNSPFVVGVAHDPNLDASQFDHLAATATAILREFKSRLPHTDVALMLDSQGTAATVLMRAARELGLLIELIPREVAVADVLVQRSSLLLALWDGRRSTAAGDTADTVSRFLGIRIERSDEAKALEVATVLDDAETTAQLVYWIPLHAQDTLISAERAKPCFLTSIADHVIDAQPEMPSALRVRLADLDAFNADYIKLTATEPGVGTTSLLNGLPIELLGEQAPALENINGQYVKADALATHMQKRSDRLFDVFGFMTFTMGLAYLIYDKIVETRLLLLGYLLILFVSMGIYYHFQQRRWFGKHLSYRALAETLRIRFYLSLAGLDHRMHTGNLIALAGIHRFRGFSWIGFVLDAITPSKSHGIEDRALYLERTNVVEQAWIEPQYRYFVRKVAKMQKDSLRVKRFKRVMFAAVLVDIGAMFIFGQALHHVDVNTGLPIKNVLTFCSGFLATVLGVWELRQSKMATRELLWQYKNQLAQFARARTQLERTTSRTARDELLLELGDNSLMETYLWAIHRYHREHSPPGAH